MFYIQEKSKKNRQDYFLECNFKIISSAKKFQFFNTIITIDEYFVRITFIQLSCKPCDDNSNNYLVSPRYIQQFRAVNKYTMQPLK